MCPSPGFGLDGRQPILLESLRHPVQRRPVAVDVPAGSVHGRGWARTAGTVGPSLECRHKPLFMHVIGGASVGRSGDSVDGDWSGFVFQTKVGNLEFQKKYDCKRFQTTNRHLETFS